MNRKPNIILITTDEERYPQHMEGINLDEILPARARLKRQGVSYENFFTNTSPCTPSRSSIMTGLYAQQTWMCYLIDLGQPSLSTEFPTYAKALRDDLGYNTSYFGKWHISDLTDHPVDNPDPTALEHYGFNYFWPGHEDNSKPVEGTMNDGKIANAFVEFLENQAERVEPFLSVLSLLNPHDVVYFHNKIVPEPEKPFQNIRIPENFETMKQLKDNKPQCQSKFREYYKHFAGDMPDNIQTEQDATQYRLYLSHYLWLQKKVDLQIQKVLEALDAKPEVQNNTIIIFTSDHGDFVGSHGMRGKDCAVYDEALKVPFYVVDYTRTLIPDKERGKTRAQLGSSIDIFPTMLGMAASGEEKRRIKERYHFLPGTDLTPNISDRTQPTRDRVLFTYDSAEVMGNNPDLQSKIAIESPTHILCQIDKEYKAAVYDFWTMNLNPDPTKLENPDGAVTIVPGYTETELYKREEDAPTEARWEVENLAKNERYQGTMDEYKTELHTNVHNAVRAPLPKVDGHNLQKVSEEAKAAYVKSLVTQQSK